MSAKPAQFYDREYFLGTSGHRGKFSLLNIGTKFIDRTQTVIDYFDLTTFEPGVVVEVGCGTAPFYRVTQIQKPIGNLTVVASDISDNGIKLLNKNVRPPFFKASADKLPFDNSSISGIILWDVLEHLDQPQAAIEEAHRVLKAGGFLHIICPNPDSWLRTSTDPKEDVYRRDQSHIFPPIVTVNYLKKILSDLNFEFDQFTRGFEGLELSKQTGLTAMRSADADSTGIHIVVFARKV